jgi:hypothetical protein
MEFMAKTEFLKNNLNPQWQPMDVSLQATGGLDTPLVLSVFDYDNNGAHDLVGNAQTTLRQLVSSKPTLALIDPVKVGNTLYRNSGILSVALAQPSQPKFDDRTLWKVTVQFRGRNLDSRDLLSKSDPYIDVKMDGNTSIHRTPHINNDHNPVWASFDLIVANCGGLGKTLTFEVWDHDKVKADDMIGSCEISLRHLLYWEKNPTWRPTNPKKLLPIGAGFLEVVSLFLTLGKHKLFLSNSILHNSSTHHSTPNSSKHPLSSSTYHNKSLSSSTHRSR